MRHRIEQARLYESFIRTWADEPGVGGITWWEWDTSPCGNDDYGYTPRGEVPAVCLFPTRQRGRPRTWWVAKARMAAASSSPI